MSELLATSRLKLREWTEDDLPPFARLNADSVVAEHLPSPLSREQSDALAKRIVDHFAEHGFGLWAVEVPSVAPFIGFVGLSIPNFEAHFTPCVEVGWRLAQEHWAQGYATEAARSAVDFAFGSLHLDALVSFTVPANTRFRRVMAKIGMTHAERDDFCHPRLPAGDRLSRHVLYRLRAIDWKCL